ncbi:hypothetical protein BS78_10G063600 [Paspalum vaginatum]|nr:hypothetical protein BS78_10G063600 [Paspalum vaginatum]
MTMSRRILAWLLVVVVFFVAGSFAAPVRSSSSHGDGRIVRAAAAAAAGAMSAGMGMDAYRGRKVWNRRSLGARKTLPPAPRSNKMRAAAMPAPPSPTKA